MHPLTTIGMTTVLCSLSWLAFAPSALANRYVLNQTPQTIQRYFGKPLKVEGGSPSDQQVYTYSSTPLKKVLPQLPKGATFGMNFINGRVVSIWLSANADPSPKPPRQPESFSFGKPEAFKLYRYIFGYNPPMWKEIDLPNGGGGHEGFLDHKFCFGDGVGVTFMTYMLGEENIRLFYDPVCELRLNRVQRSEESRV